MASGEWIIINKPHYFSVDVMRIVHLSYAHIIEYSNPDDYLKRIDFFAVLLREMAKDLEVHSIHCINFKGILNRDGVKYHFLKLEKYETIISFGINRYVSALNPDVVLVHGMHFPLQVLFLRKQLGPHVKIVMQNHAEGPLRNYKGFLQRLVDKSVSAYFFTSLNQTTGWLKEGQIESDKKIYEVMEVPSVFYPMDKVEAKKRTGVSCEKIYLWVGRFDSNNDPITLVNGFIQFAKSNSDSCLYIIGHGGDLLPLVEKRLNSSPAEKERIKLIGKVEHSELLYWYNSVDFIISTSHYEGSGVAICEGMSCGNIPVLTDIASFKMMLGTEPCGELYTPGDVHGLVSALEKCNQLSLPEASKKVLEQYNKNLSAVAISNKMISVFKNI